MAFELPQLPYAYALEPILMHTMEIHHSKHHNAYTTTLMQQQQVLIWKATIENILLTLT
jgi:Fe-Mn family superoxide dismutase